MPDRNDLLLGQIAVERALVAPEQLEDALREQEAQTPPMPLGAILIARGLLTGEQLLDLVDEHRRRLALPPAGFGSRYLIRGEIARGGMGIILDGTDVDIRRELAIKVLPPPHDVNPESRVRFTEEAQIQGQLEHPNICPVHELGEKPDGKPFFTMKKVKGRSLAQLFESLRRSAETSTGREMSLPRLLEIFTKACDAMAFAHSRGVIHRDLKPHNIMIGEFGEVLVMDWGLAKVAGRSRSADPRAVVSDRAEQGVELSLDGSVMGTPAYMPPEQAEGRLEAIDERSDIYSLGAILYEILTLRPPVEGTNVTEVLARASSGDILPPSRKAPGRPVPADLEAAALKALARRPEERYSTVRDLREDITAYLEGRTMAAVEYTALQVAAKWFRRNRVFAATAAASALLLLAGTIVYLVNVTKARDRAEEATRDAVREAAHARAAEGEAKRRRAESLVAQGDALGSAGRWGEARTIYAEAAGVWRGLPANPLSAEIALQEAWRRSPPPLLSMPGVALYGAAVSPDGRWALAAGEDTNLVLRDLSTGRAVLTLSGHSKQAWSAAFCPDGRRAVSGSWDGTAKLWDLDTGKMLGSFVGQPGGTVLGVAVSPDGRRSASAGGDGTVCTWELSTGRALLKIDAHRSQAYGVAFSPDGLGLLTGGADGRVRLWDANSGKPLLDLAAHGRPVTSVGFSPDGRRAVTASWDQTAKVWDLGTGTLVCAFRGHTNTLWQASFSPDGRSVISGGNDDVVRIWDAATGAERMALVGHADDIYAVRFLPDGRRAISASYDQTLKVWEVDAEGRSAVVATQPGEVHEIALSPDGSLALSAAADVWLWDAGTGRPLRSLYPHAGPATSVAFLPDGRRALIGGSDGSLRLVDLASGEELKRLEGHRAAVRSIVPSRDGARAVTGSEDKTVRVWDLEGGKETRSMQDREAVHVVAFLPGERQILSAGMDFHLRIWDAASGQEVRALNRGGGHGVYGLAITADGSRVLIGAGRDPSLGLWDLTTGRPIRPFPGHTAAVLATELFAGGALAISGGADRTLRVWDMESGAEIRSVPSPSGPVRSVVVSPDGRWVLAAAGKDLVRWPLVRPDDPDLEARVDRALKSPSDDPSALATLGEWHAFRGAWSPAADLLRRARAGGAKTSALLIGRCLWRAGRAREALAEFERSLADREASPFYLERCIEALRSAATR